MLSCEYVNRIHIILNSMSASLTYNFLQGSFNLFNHLISISKISYFITNVNKK